MSPNRTVKLTEASLTEQKFDFKKSEGLSEKKENGMKRATENNGNHTVKLTEVSLTEQKF